jgi:microcystin-dependent protein
MFAGIFAPVEWAFRKGQILPISGYEPLYAFAVTRGGDGKATLTV